MQLRFIVSLGFHRFGFGFGFGYGFGFVFGSEFSLGLLHTLAVFISRHNLYEPTYLLNVLAVVLTASSRPGACVQPFGWAQLPASKCHKTAVGKTMRFSVKYHTKRCLKYLKYVLKFVEKFERS